MNNYHTISIFSVIKYHKVHYSNFYNHFFNKGNTTLTIKDGVDLKRKQFNNLKTRSAIRSAIIIGHTYFSYFIVPTTTKLPKGNLIKYRTEIKLNGVASLICWDQLNHIDKKQVTGYFKNNGSRIVFNSSAKKLIKKTIFKIV